MTASLAGEPYVSVFTEAIFTHYAWGMVFVTIGLEPSLLCTYINVVMLKCELFILQHFTRLSSYLTCSNHAEPVHSCVLFGVCICNWQCKTLMYYQCGCCFRETQNLPKCMYVYSETAQDRLLFKLSIFHVRNFSSLAYSIHVQQIMNHRLICLWSSTCVQWNLGNKMWILTIRACRDGKIRPLSERWSDQTQVCLSVWGQSDW